MLSVLLANRLCQLDQYCTHNCCTLIHRLIREGVHDVDIQPVPLFIKKVSVTL